MALKWTVGNNQAYQLFVAKKKTSITNAFAGKEKEYFRGNNSELLLGLPVNSCPH